MLVVADPIKLRAILHERRNVEKLEKPCLHHMIGTRNGNK